MSYYGRMGFAPVPPGRLVFAGPVDPARLLYCELVQGAFEGVQGKVRRVHHSQSEAPASRPARSQ
jgi:predicted N-acetyltransferase YhbS